MSSLKTFQHFLSLLELIQKISGQTSRDNLAYLAIMDSVYTVVRKAEQSIIESPC